MKKIIIMLLITLIASTGLSEEIYNEIEISQIASSLRDVLNDNLNEVMLEATTDITKLYPLMGYWDFTYTIISTWTDTYKLYNIYESEREYYIEGYDVGGGAASFSYLLRRI